jgi:glycosidase
MQQAIIPFELMRDPSALQQPEIANIVHNEAVRYLFFLLNNVYLYHFSLVIWQKKGVASRDGCRTPMQWNGLENAGFSPAGKWHNLF